MGKAERVWRDRRERASRERDGDTERRESEEVSGEFDRWREREREVTSASLELSEEVQREGSERARCVRRGDVRPSACEVRVPPSLFF